MAAALGIKQPPPRLQGRRSIFAAARCGHGGLRLATACIAFANVQLSGPIDYFAEAASTSRKKPHGSSQDAMAQR
jgi:hypothetical protein